MTRFEFKLPDIGEGTVEGEIVRWLVKPGDPVALDQPVAEIMTDKATVEITSPYRGTILELPWKEGDKVPVGKVLLVVGDGEAAASSEAAEAPAAVAARPAQAAAAGGPAAAPPAAGATAVAVLPAPAVEAAPGAKPLAAPATRKLARELGVDLRKVAGTGPYGRITRDDVLLATSAAEAAAPAAAPAAVPAVAPAPATVPTVEVPPAAAPEGVAAGEEEHVPYRGLRRAIGEQMVRSKFTAPHFAFADEADVTDLVRLRDRAKARAEEGGTKLSFLPFIAKAITAALKKFPYVNAELRESDGVIVLKRYYHIGIATATERGLIVTVVRDADRKSILEVAREIQDLADRARGGTVRPEELKGSTFTITSLGRSGGLLSTPIINYPEVAICGVHKIRTQPVWQDNAWQPRAMMNLSFSFDHRVVDGHVGAAFAAEAIRYLETPDLMLLEGI